MSEHRQLVSHKKRESTDLVCLIIFVSFTIVMLIAGLYCFFKGSVSKLNIPYDPDSKGCGVDYPDYKYIYFPSPQYDSLWVTTCVKECPSQSDKTIKCQPNSVVTTCLQNNSVDNTKAFHIYGTSTFRESICLPNDLVIRQKVWTGISGHYMQQLFSAVIKDWSLFLLMLPIIIVMIMIVLILIRLTAGYVVYVLYGITIVFFIGFGVYMAIPTDYSHQTFLLKKNKIVAVLVSILSFIIATVILCIFCSFRAKIKAAIQFIDNSNQFVKNNYTVLILPFILIAFLVLFICFWIFLNVAFYSMSSTITVPKQLPFQHYRLSPILIAVLIVNIFYLIWGVFFLMHTGNFIISGTVVNWQYERENPYLASSKSYFISHIGSACTGSFFTSLLGLFKFQLDEADCSQREQQKEKKCIDWLKGCYGFLCCCCITLLFKCFHHAAYVYQNLTGLAYCQSSSQIYQIIRQQKQKWGIIAFLYMIFDQFIPLTFTVINVIIGHLLINAIELYKINTNNRILVLLIIGIIAYTISQFFIGIYSETIQSLFVIQQFHNSILQNKQMYQLRLSLEWKQDKSERLSKPQSPRYSLFSKSIN